MKGLTILFRPLLLRIGCAMALAIVTISVRASAQAQMPRVERAHAESVQAEPQTSSGTTQRDPIAVEADYLQQWDQDQEAVCILRGRCQVVQGQTSMTARQAVLWRQRDDNAQRDRIWIYLEEDVRLEQPGSTLTERSLLLELATRSGVTISPRRGEMHEPAPQDPLVLRGARRRSVRRQPPVHQTQYSPLEADPSGPELRSVQLEPAATSLRRIRLYPRSSVPFTVESRESRATTPPEQVFIITGGVNLVVDGVDERMGTVGLWADRMVIWTQLSSDANLGGENIQTQDTPLQVYLEGNIVIRQGTNVVRATQGFYDAREDNAILENAELKTQFPLLGASVRVRAERLRQLSADTFQAQRAWITTSEFGKPGYRLQASDLFIEPRNETWIGQADLQMDPESGEMVQDPVPWATTLNNTFYLDDLPLFYFPYLSFPAEDPNIPLRTARFQNDQIFGTQFYTTWNMFKLLGMDSRKNTRWDLHLDYLSKRGFEVGTSGNYAGANRFGLAGPYAGQGLGYFIHDSGLDRLGLDRLELVPQQKDRGRFLVRDRQTMPYGFSSQVEFAYLSDRNYLEQYAETEFDAGKDYESLLYLKQQPTDSFWAWSATTRPRLYNYYNETEWLPRGDLYLLGVPLFGDLLTVSDQTSLSYATSRIADAPTDPNDLYSVLPYEGNGSGMVFSKRSQVNLPFDLGPVHVVPYALGDYSHWGDDFTGASLDRLYGSAGARGSIEFWRPFPEVQNSIFGLNGLAHKMVFDADYSISDANVPLASVPQYNELDDNAQEQFRRRLLFNTFGGTLPPQFDPRFLAVRTGAAHNVTSPYDELLARQQVLRLGWRHRLQTKAGPLNSQRIKNWMTLDLETSFFPDPDRDNFGEDFGLYGARYAWFVGDRTTFTASTYFDTFTNAQKLWSVGIQSQRTARGNIYLGLRSIEAGSTLRSQIASATFTYNMSPKWIGTVGTSYNLGEHQNLGQTVTVTRVGKDFLLHVGGLIDPLKQNVGFAVSIEPRFAPALNSSGSPFGSLLGGNQPSARR